MVWTWADKSRVIYVRLLELARKKSAQHINPAKEILRQSDFLGNALLPLSSAWGGESTKHEPEEKCQGRGHPVPTQTPWWWLGLSLRRQRVPGTEQGWEQDDRISSC